METNYSTFIALPVILVLYWLSVALLCIYSIPEAKQDGWYIIPNVIFSATTPFLITNRRFPEGVKHAIQISMPVSVMVAICIISIGISSTPQCAVDLLFDQHHPRWDRIVIWTVLPIPAMFTMWTILLSCNSGRTIDVATIILIVASYRLLGVVSAPAVLSSVTLALLLSVRLYISIYPVKAI
jgi:hypothetical protein